MLQHAQPGQPAWPGVAAEAQRAASGSSPPQQQVYGSTPPGQDIPGVAGSTGEGGPGSDAAGSAGQLASLFPHFSPEAADLFVGSGNGGSAAAQHAQQAQQQQVVLKQNLQKLYGSLGLQHGSRSSLPDIQEHEPQMILPSDPPLSAAQRLPYGRPPAGRALSDEDLFGMQVRCGHFCIAVLHAAALGLVLGRVLLLARAAQFRPAPATACQLVWPAAACQPTSWFGLLLC